MGVYIMSTILHQLLVCHSVVCSLLEISLQCANSTSHITIAASQRGYITHTHTHTGLNCLLLQLMASLHNPTVHDYIPTASVN